MILTRSPQFKKDYALAQKQWDIAKLDDIILRLANSEDLSGEYKIYPLGEGFLKDYWILYIQRGWGLIYKKDIANDELLLARTGDPGKIS